MLRLDTILMGRLLVLVSRCPWTSKHTCSTHPPLTGVLLFLDYHSCSSSSSITHHSLLGQFHTSFMFDSSWPRVGVWQGLGLWVKGRGWDWVMGN